MLENELNNQNLIKSSSTKFLSPFDFLQDFINVGA